MIQLLLQKIILLLLVSFIIGQYQKCTHLIGSGKKTEEKIGIEKGNDNFGGIFGSTSFLINSNSQILIFFGKTNSYLSDQIWKYSITENQWKFVKGRKDKNQGPIFSDLNTFKEVNEIGSRYSLAGWKNQEIITFFGGEGYTKGNSKINYLNEIWRYNISSNSYSVMRCNNCNGENDSFYANFTSSNSFNSYTIPGGRKLHSVVTINDQLIMLIGGYGYSKSSNNCYLGDWYVFSTELMEWSYLGGDLEVDSAVFFYGETDIYHPNNQIGSIRGTSETLINDEEVLFFGGIQINDYLNTIFKYNITSNYWKYVLGGKDEYGTGYLRYFNSSNSPGARYGHKIWKFNNHEVLLFGGFGYCFFSEQETGFLNDEWRFDINSNLWKFVGKEKTKLKDREPYFSSNEYSDETLIGGIQNFIGEYIEENQELIICNGFGYSIYGNSETLDDCWNFYYGNICNLLRDTDPNVCLGRGECTNYNFCECEDGFFGDDCQLTKCNGILSNETDLVCSQKGVCIDSTCACFESSIYNNPDCTVNEELESLMNNLWLYIIIPFAILLIVIFFVFSLFGIILLAIKLRKTLKKFDGIENVDIILEEAKIEQHSTNPKIKINKELFKIDYKDIKLVSILGEGGQSTCFLCQWQGIFCAFKSFSKSRICSFQSNDEELYKDFEKEVKIYSSINHPSILQFYGACINLPHIGILLQYCQFGDLNSFLSRCQIKNKKKYSIRGKIRILKEISTGMQYLHGLKIFHRDLKPDNILIDDNEHPKIMDFGFSRFTSKEEKTMTKKIGTSYYMAPEVFVGNQKYSMKCDVYSFAILVLVVITENYFPYGISFNGTNQNILLQKISKNANFRPKIEEKLFENYEWLIKLIKRNWSSDSKKRNSFGEIVEILKKKEENDSKKENEKTNEVDWKKEFERIKKENDNNIGIIKKLRKDILKSKETK